MDNYLAFFVAMNDFELFLTTFKHHCTGLYTIGIEYALDHDVHNETDGEHYHVFAQMTDKQYRALILKLKYLKVPLNGQSKGNKTRSYGKVKLLRDPMKMLAYTIKGGSYITTESDEVIENAKLLSFVKEDPIIKTREKIMSFLDNEIDDLKPNLVQYATSPVPPFYDDETIADLTLLTKIKLLIIKYFRQSREKLKMPSRSRLIYFAQYYCMYHHKDKFTDLEILQMFY